MKPLHEIQISERLARAKLGSTFDVLRIRYHFKIPTDFVFAGKEYDEIIQGNSYIFRK